MSITVTQVAEYLHGELEGDETLSLVGLAEIDEACTNQLCFAKTEQYLAALEASSAGAAIVPKLFPSIKGKVLIRVEDPGLAFIRALELFSPGESFTGVHESAVVASSARLGEKVSIGPNAVIEEGARIGSGVTIRAGAFIGADVTIGDGSEVGPNASILHGCKIGRDCLLHPGVCIGADGYGFRWLGDHHHKIPQLGIVVIGDNVEIGANAYRGISYLGLGQFYQARKKTDQARQYIGRAIEILEECQADHYLQKAKQALTSLSD